ncbi:hypothetical protein LTR36_008483, partial [Oleoguttula mirabilis]
KHAKEFKAPIHFSEFPNEKAIMIISCVDPRADPKEFWDFGKQRPGVIRNAGGRARDTLRSLRGLSTIMGYGKNTVGAVAVVHHTDCGMINFDDDFIRGKLKDRVSDSPELVSEVDKMEIGSFSDIEASVREDVEIIKTDPFLPKDLVVLGFVYDTFTGKTTEVV